MRKLRAGATQSDNPATQRECVNPLVRAGKQDREASIINAPKSFDLEKISQLLNNVIQVLSNNNAESIYGFDGYTGCHPMACDNYYSTAHASKQLMFAIAMSQHPIVESLAESYERLYEKILAEKMRQVNDEICGKELRDELRKYVVDWQDQLKCYSEREAKAALAGELVHAKILAGFRILDLGCGCSPGFAGCARALGAEVFTVDVIGAQDMIFTESKEPAGEKERQTKINNHIQIDLCEPEALDLILKRTGGNFDLVTQAILRGVPFDGFVTADPPPFGKLLRIVIPLIRPGGLYFRTGQVTTYAKLAVKDGKSERWDKDYGCEFFYTDSIDYLKLVPSCHDFFGLNEMMERSLEHE